MEQKITLRKRQKTILRITTDRGIEQTQRDKENRETKRSKGGRYKIVTKPKTSFPQNLNNPQ